MTNGEFVSGIMNDARLLSKDTYISRRHILAKGRSIADTYIAQRIDSHDLTFEYDLVSVIDCFEMKSSDYISCEMIDLKLCKSIMKSKNKLPKTINGRIGVGVLSVTSIDGEYEFKQISSRGFKDKLNNKYVRDKSGFYIIQDGYLILPNSSIEVVRVELLALDESEIEDCGCGETKGSDCKTVWEQKFICPANIFSMVRDKTAQEIATLYLGISPDENPNMNENVKN